MEYKPNKFDAVHSLVGGQLTFNADEEFIYHDDQTEPTESEITTELARLVGIWDDQEYARNRAADYPDTGAQFNKIYDDGLTKWKSEMVDPVKTKWPKDNSGPVE